MVQSILAFLLAHAAITTGLSIWAVLSLVVNIVLAIRGPAAWVAFAEKNPTVALIVNVLFRAFGIDLVSVIQHIQAWLNAKAQGKTPAPAPAPAAPADPKPPSN